MMTYNQNVVLTKAALSPRSGPKLWSFEKHLNSTRSFLQIKSTTVLSANNHLNQAWADKTLFILTLHIIFEDEHNFHCFSIHCNILVHDLLLPPVCNSS